MDWVRPVVLTLFAGSIVLAVVDRDWLRTARGVATLSMGVAILSAGRAASIGGWWSRRGPTAR